MAVHIQRINVGVQIVLTLVLHMKIYVHHLHAGVFKILVDIIERLNAVNETNLDALDGVHMYQPLKHSQRDHDRRTAGKRHAVVSHARSKTQARHIPQRRRRSQTSDLIAVIDDRPRAEEADTADNLCCDASHADRNARPVTACIQRNGIGDHIRFEDCDHRRSYAHQHVRPHTGRTVLFFTFDTDNTPQRNRQQNSKPSFPPNHFAQLPSYFRIYFNIDFTFIQYY